MRPLEGTRIIDLTVAVAGPVATALLGDLGTEVIRVEPPWPRSIKHLEVTRPRPGAADLPYNRIVSYNDLHRSKRALTLDLSTAAGRDVLLRLVRQSDAVVENMSPRVLPALGLSYEEMCAHNGSVVLVSMPAFGSGPLRDRVAYGPGIDAMSGLSYLTGYADRGPMNPANYYADYNTALLAAFATTAAIIAKRRTGRGRHVEVAMLEGELQVVADGLMDYATNGRVQTRSGNAHATMAPHGVFRCAGEDRWLAIACEDDAQWRTLCGLMGKPEFADDERFADVVSRVRHRTMADAELSAWTAALDAHEASERLQRAGIPAGAARTVGELFDDPLLRERRFIRFVEHPQAGPFPHARAAFMLSKTPAEERHAPLYAEDATYVLKGLLGMSDHDVEQLVEEGVTALAGSSAAAGPNSK